MRENHRFIRPWICFFCFSWFFNYCFYFNTLLLTISLQIFDTITYFYLTNCMPPLLIFFFFSFLLIINLIASIRPKFTTIWLTTSESFVLVIIALFMLFFLLRLGLSTVLQDEFSALNFYSSTFSHYFGGTLVILVLLITFCSWWFLSERFIFKNRFLVPYLLVFFFCTINLVSTPQLVVMFIFFEFIFFPSLFFAYSLSYSKKAEKTIEYLVTWTLAGAMIAFSGFGMLFYITGTADSIITNSFTFSKVELFSLFMLFFIGFGIKVPVWPFYYWLTKVHVEAPTGFSMFLSGFLVKTAFFCLSQLFFFLYLDIGFNLALSLVLWGVCDASSRMWSLLDIKRLIALATVQEMNMIMIFLFLLSNTNYTILNSFLLIHGLLSVFLFFLVDVVYKQAQTRNLTVLGGLGLSSPHLLIFVWLAILIYRGFPIFSKFLVEWELGSVLINNFWSFGFLLVLFFSMLGAGSFFKHWSTVSYSSPELISVQHYFSYRDLMIGSICVVSLFSLNFLLYLF